MCCPSSVASDVQCFKVIDFTKWLHSVLFATSVQMFQFDCRHARLNVCYTIRNLLVMQWLFNFSVYLIMDRRVLLRQECVWNETGGSAQWWRKWQWGSLCWTDTVVGHVQWILERAGWGEYTRPLQQAPTYDKSLPKRRGKSGENLRTYYKKVSPQG